MKFLVDMPLSPTLARWLVEHGHQANHAADVGLERAPDIDIIRRAQSESRVVITADLDCPRLLALAGAAQPGLILFRGGDWSETDVIARMNELLSALSPADIESSVLVVDRDRIRRRRLPIAG